MKKFLTSCAIAIIFTLSANAQDSTTTSTTTQTNSTANTTTPATNAPKRLASPEFRKKMHEERLAKKQEIYNNATPEQKARMDAMSKLTPEQKEAVRKEKERHHAEMRKITGIEIYDNR